MKRKNRIISLFVCIAMAVSSFAVPLGVSAAESTKRMEYLSRGLTAVKTDEGVYLSWRLLGTESMTQKYDIYRDGIKITTVDATNYTDNGGFSYNVYNVVPEGETPKLSENASVWQNNYIDIPLDRPDGGVTKSGESYTYSVNDTSVGDVDGDGEYEYIIKWDPSNSKDNSEHGYTGNVLLDCYKLDGTKLWRIDLGVNIRAGAHYTQFIVYDFDGDGKAEVAMRTAPGSKDGNGNYVSDAGTNLTWDGYDNGDDLRQGGSKSGHIIKGPDWLTMFNGETGAAMQTIDYYPQRGAVKSWGKDSYGGRSERYLAGVAYLNGTTPSLIMCRGYYEKAAMAAFDWDGSKFTQRWAKTFTSKSSTSLYAQGTHSLSVADVDNDGFDEVIFGSAVMDHNGNVLNSTGHGHGDALHVSDFNNDGEQEIMMVHEEKTYYRNYGAEVRKGKDASIIANVGASSDCGRGIMGNVDDEYASENPSVPSLFWSAANDNVYDSSGNTVTRTVTTTDDGSTVTREENAPRPSSYNFLIYWDGDLGRELLDRNRIEKYSVQDGTQRLETFSGVHYNNSSKATPALSGDLFGDWREEVAYGTDDNKALRIYTTTTPTDYKLTTLMHDSQYRCAIAWQNVGYNQPPHTSYYIGSSALASGQNYLSPTAGFDTIEYAAVPTSGATPDMTETNIYTVNSFDEGTSGFTSGSVSTLGAPYNNALYVSSSSTLDFGFSVSTPDPNATPTPSPSPSPKPEYTAQPIPTLAPDTVYSNDFDSLNAGILVETKTQLNHVGGVSYYNDIDGIQLMTGYRDGADGTNWSIGFDGISENVLILNNGRFTNGARGPRVSFETPALEDGEKAELSINAKLFTTSTNAPVIRYNDSATSEAGTDISSYFSTDSYTTFRTVIERNGDSYTRTLYAGDTAITSDSKASFPVIWGALPENTDYYNTGIYFDNFSVTVSGDAYAQSDVAISEFEITSDKAARAVVENYTDEEVMAELYIAVYNSDDTLASVKRESVTVYAKNSLTILTDGVTVPEYGYTRAFIWSDRQRSYKESITDKIASLFESLTTTAYADEAPLDAEGTYRLAFDWKPGSSIKLLSTNGENLVTLSKSSGSAIRYASGNGEARTLNSSLSASDAWFHIDMVFDFTAKTVDISALDYTNNGDTKTVYSCSFAGVDGFLGSMKISGSTYIDNLTVNGVTYNVDRSLINIYASDTSGSPVEGASVAIGSKILTTDSSGHAAIKLNSGEYSYSISKAEYKTTKGTVDATNDVDINGSLQDGEERNIYVRAVYNGDVVLDNPIFAGTQLENTTYTVPDSAKDTVTFTFPSGDGTNEDVDEVIPGYEDEAGKTYVFEYDPDNSDTVDINVEEGADTYITLSYVKRLAPTETDTEIVNIYMSEDGTGRSYWSANGAEFMQDEETGRKYTNFANIASNPVTISFDNTSEKIVFEYDIMYKELDYGGNYFGFIPYYNNTQGQGFGMRTSRPENNQWQWCYRKDGDQYIARVDSMSDKGYSYYNNWQNQWAHVIVSCDGTQLKVTAANRNTGIVYIQDQIVPLDNSVGSSSRPINKVVFGRTYGSGDGTIGIANFRAYIPGAPATGELVESTANIKPADELSFASGMHASAMDGVEYDASTLINATYELQNESGETVTPDGLTISDSGVLTSSVESFDGMEQYYVVVKYSGTPVKKIKLNYLTKSLTTKTYKGFGDGGLGNFTITPADGYSLSNENGTLKIYREPNTAINDDVYINFPFTNDTIDEEFYIHFDMKSVSGSSKGYMRFYNGVKNQLMNAETRFYEPRIKWYTTASENTNWYGPEHDKWLTYVFHGTDMSSSTDHNMTLTIYDTQELIDAGYKRTVDGVNETGIDLSNVTGVDPVYTLNITPYTTNLSGGMRLEIWLTQNLDKGDAANADELYFDNVYYQYYEYK